jgi:hypothetical protein
MSQEGELLVVLINRITLAKVSLPASQVAEYLKKHTLYQEMPQYEPVHKKVRTKKIKKAVKPPKDEPKTRYERLFPPFRILKVSEHPRKLKSKHRRILRHPKVPLWPVL